MSGTTPVVGFDVHIISLDSVVGIEKSQRIIFFLDVHQSTIAVVNRLIFGRNITINGFSVLVKCLIKLGLYNSQLNSNSLTLEIIIACLFKGLGFVDLFSVILAISWWSGHYFSLGRVFLTTTNYLAQQRTSQIFRAINSIGYHTRILRSLSLCLFFDLLALFFLFYRFLFLFIDTSLR